MEAFLERLKLLQGDMSDAEFARRSSVKYTTMKNYLLGRSLPPLDIAAQIADAHGVSIDWLVGKGLPDKTASVATPKGATVTSEALKVIGHLVTTLHKEAGVRLPPAAIIPEVARHYEALVARMDDPGDIDELKSLVLWVENRIRKELSAVAAEPGTGKREAS